MEESLNIRLQELRQMILEMASGRFHYRVPRNGEGDQIEAFGLALNILAEEVQDAMIHQGYVNRDFPVQAVVQMSFILTDEGMIEMINTEALNILGLKKKEVLRKPFAQFLDLKTQKSWQALIQEPSDFKKTVLELSFQTAEGLIIPKTAHLTRFKTMEHTQRLLITIFHYDAGGEQLQMLLSQQQGKKKNGPHPKAVYPRKSKLSLEDIAKIKKAKELIVAELDQDFGSLRTFALKVGTNEFKLKYGFKELNGTTVYQFLLQERLRKALMLVKHSDLPFKQIAKDTGFGTLNNFSRSFKKAYRHSPRAIRNQNRK